MGSPRASSVFSRRSIANGDEEWTAEHVSPPADLRLFRASVSGSIVLRTDRDERVRVSV